MRTRRRDGKIATKKTTLKHECTLLALTTGCLGEWAGWFVRAYSALGLLAVRVVFKPILLVRGLLVVT